MAAGVSPKLTNAAARIAGAKSSASLVGIAVVCAAAAKFAVAAGTVSCVPAAYAAAVAVSQLIGGVLSGSIALAVSLIAVVSSGSSARDIVELLAVGGIVVGVGAAVAWARARPYAGSAPRHDDSAVISRLTHEVLRFRDIVEGNPMMAWACDPEGRPEYLSPEWYRFTGVSTLEELGPGGWGELVHPDDRERSRSEWVKASKTGEVRNEVRLRRSDGVYRWCDVRGRSIRDENGIVVRWIGANVDVHENHELRETLRRENEKWSYISASSPVGIGSFKLSADGVPSFPFCSHRLASFYDSTPEELLGDATKIFNTMWPEDAVKVRSDLAESARTMSPLYLSFRVCRARLGQAWLEVHGHPIAEPDGSVVWHGVVLDVTQSRRTEIRLREQAAMFQLAERAASFGTFEWNMNTHVNHWTPSLESMYGLPPGGFKGTQDAWEELVHPDDRAEAVSKVAQALATGEPTESEWRVVTPDGGTRWMFGRYQAFRDELGRPERLVGVNLDVTERKKAAMALRDREERLQAILNTAVDAIVTINEHGVIMSANHAVETIFGYRMDELIGRNVTMLMPDSHKGLHEHFLGRYLETGERRIIGVGREVPGRRKDGSEIPLELGVSEVLPGRLFTGIMRDISRRKELEREVMEVAALEQQRIGTELHDSVGQELTGLGMMAEVLHQRIQETCPDDAPLAARLEAGIVRAHTLIRSISHGLFPVELDAEGLRAALEELSADLNQQPGLKCVLIWSQPAKILDSVAATNLFRIAQESVANALRHGKARRIEIRLRVESTQAKLTIVDDGTGMPTPSPEGVGVRIMRHRTRLLGGSLYIGVRPEGGTVVECTIPQEGIRGDQGGGADNGKG